jgi:hypothetical protein
MAITFTKKVKAQTEVVAETVASLPVMVQNKASFPFGKTRHVMFGVGATCYHHQKAKEKAAGSTLTDYVTITNPGNDRDYNDATAASVSVAAGATQDIRQYDFGVSKERVAQCDLGSAAAGIYSEVLYSVDGSTWNTLFSKDSTHAMYCGKATFRYLKWRGRNTTGSGNTVYLYTIEAFDLDDYNGMSNTGELVVEGFGDIGWVSLVGTGSVAYYVYDVSQVKVTHVEGSLLM